MRNIFSRQEAYLDGHWHKMNIDEVEYYTKHSKTIKLKIDAVDLFNYKTTEGFEQEWIDGVLKTFYVVKKVRELWRRDINEILGKVCDCKCYLCSKTVEAYRGGCDVSTLPIQGNPEVICFDCQRRLDRGEAENAFEQTLGLLIKSI